MGPGLRGFPEGWRWPKHPQQEGDSGRAPSPSPQHHQICKLSVNKWPGMGLLAQSTLSTECLMGSAHVSPL